MAKLTWHGDKIKLRVARAARGAINEVAGEAAGELRARVPVATGRLKRSIRVLPAERVDPGVHAGGVNVSMVAFFGKNKPVTREVERKMRAKLPAVVRRRFRNNTPSGLMGDD